MGTADHNSNTTSTSTSTSTSLPPTPTKHWVSLSSPTPVPCPYTTQLLRLPNELLTTLCATAISNAAIKNDELPTKGSITRFHAKEKLQLNLKDYLERLRVYTPFPRDAVLLSLLYLDRITRLPLDPPIPDCSSHPIFGTPPPPSPPITTIPLSSSFEECIPLIPAPSPSSSVPSSPTSPSSPSSPKPPVDPKPVPPPIRSPTPLLNSFTLHRLLAASLLISSKFTSDGSIPQSRAAKVAGVDKAELVRLEVEFLKCLDWVLGYRMGEVEWVSRELLALGEREGLVGGEVASDAGSTSDEGNRTTSNESTVPSTPARSDEGHSHAHAKTTSEETIRAQVEELHVT